MNQHLLSAKPLRIAGLAAALFGAAWPGLSFAGSQLKEDWKDQKVGDTAKELQRWTKAGNGADADLAIVEIDGKRVLEVHHRSEEKYTSLGISSKEQIEWENELKISFDAAFMPEAGTEGLPWVSLVVRLKSGNKSYQVNISPAMLMFSRADPTMPNPDSGAVDPNFTPLYRTKAGERQYSSPEMKHYDLVFTRTSGGEVNLDVFVNNEPLPAGSYVDSTPSTFNSNPKVQLLIENLGWMKIGGLVVESK